MMARRHHHHGNLRVTAHLGPTRRTFDKAPDAVRQQTHVAPSLRMVSTGHHCDECEEDEEILIDTDGVKCYTCGQVLENVIFDTGPEYRSFADDDERKKDRVGRGVKVEIGKSSSNHSGVAFQPRTPDTRDASTFAGAVAKKERLATWAKVRSAGYRVIDRVCVEMRLSSASIKAQAKEIFSIFGDSGRGQCSRGVPPSKKNLFVGVAISVACKQAGANRTMKEIARACRVEEKPLRKCFFRLQKYNPEIICDPGKPWELAHRYAQRLFAGRVKSTWYIVSRAARAALKAVFASGELAGRNPSSVAAAGIFVAALLSPSFGALIKSKVAPRAAAAAAAVTEGPCLDLPSLSLVCGMTEKTVMATVKLLVAALTGSGFALPQSDFPDFAPLGGATGRMETLGFRA